MVQAEGPMANVPAGMEPARDEFIEAEFRRIVDTYGNHPSFCTMTLGNEYGGKNELLTRWVLDADAQGLMYGLRLPNGEILPSHNKTHLAECLRRLALFGMGEA